MHSLDFERPVTDLEAKIEELRHISDGGRVNIADEIGNLQDKVDKQLRGIYGKLTPAQKVQVPRHPDRRSAGNRRHCQPCISAVSGRC